MNNEQTTVGATITQNGNVEAYKFEPAVNNAQHTTHPWT